MKLLRHLLLCALLSLSLASIAYAGTEEEIVQLGGGYEVMVACEGTKVRFDRIGTDQVRVSCHTTAERKAPKASPIQELRLDRGESTTLFCQGLKLVTKKQGGTRVRANCTPIPAPSI